MVPEARGALDPAAIYRQRTRLDGGGSRQAAVGRLQRVDDPRAISVTVPAWQILLTIILFGMIYLLLFVAWLTVLRREMAHGPRKRSGRADDRA